MADMLDLVYGNLCDSARVSLDPRGSVSLMQRCDGFGADCLLAATLSAVGR